MAVPLTTGMSAVVGIGQTKYKRCRDDRDNTNLETLKKGLKGGKQ